MLLSGLQKVSCGQGITGRCLRLGGTRSSSSIIASGSATGVVPPVPNEIPRTRRLRLAREDFEVHGFTAGCGGCIALQNNRGISRNHSELCGTRMEVALAETEEGVRFVLVLSNHIYAYRGWDVSLQ